MTTVHMVQIGRPVGHLELSAPVEAPWEAVRAGGIR
jgi:hypothetical protein